MVGILQQPAELPRAASPPLRGRETTGNRPKIKGFWDNYTVGSSGNDFKVFTSQFNFI
jgi:hypothetical protein